MQKPGKDGAPSPVNPGDSATRQEVRLGGPPTRTRWGGYHLVRPGGPPGPKGVYYPQNQTSNLRPMSVRGLRQSGLWGPSLNGTALCRLQSYFTL